MECISKTTSFITRNTGFAYGNLQKCQIKYNQLSAEINLVDYKPKILSTLLLFENNRIDYHYKFTDRQELVSPFEISK